jgi:disulfide oxidoreductase YuzD
MKNFKINFLDVDNNEVYSKTKEFDNQIEASMYAYLVLATTSDECVSFSIIEL